jgi:Bacitracin resistance protein BacA
VPITTAAAGLSLADATSTGMDRHETLLFLLGSLSAAAVGYLAIRFLLRYLTRHSLAVFAYYRFALAVRTGSSSGRAPLVGILAASDEVRRILLPRRWVNKAAASLTARRR